MTAREVVEWQLFYKAEQDDEASERQRAENRAKSPYND